MNAVVSSGIRLCLALSFQFLGQAGTTCNLVLCHIKSFHGRKGYINSFVLVKFLWINRSGETL